MATPTSLTPDTICAVATAPGIGGIAVVRVCGPQALAAVDALRPKGAAPLAEQPDHTARLITLLDTDHSRLDQCLATVMRAPHSYTGDDTVELAIHGSRWIQQRTLQLLIEQGCRLAQPGEYTRRAYIAGHLDLAQAEAVADLIAADSRAAHRVATSQMRGDYSARLRTLRDNLVQLAALLELELDFSDQEVEFASRTSLRTLAHDISHEVNRLADSFAAGDAIRRGIPVAIVGATNAGKSSLLNALVGDDRAIVSDIHGTTRDIVEDTITLGDYTFRLQDTAGQRHTTDIVERLGIERSQRAASAATIVIEVIDVTDPAAGRIDPGTIHSATTHILVANKIDIAPDAITPGEAIPLSANTGQGLNSLRQALIAAAQRTEATHGAADTLVTNARHYDALRHASTSIEAVIDGLAANLSGELIAQDIRQTITHLSEILGDITTPDLLTTIFSKFCIGK